MSDLVERKVIAQITFDEETLHEIVKEAVERFKEEYKTKDRPQGEWIWQLADNGWVDHICSVCGHTENTDIHVSLGWKYCPNCGADMKGEDNEID